MRIVFGLILSLVGMSAGSTLGLATEPSSGRVALVIANSNYASAPALPNPARDAEAVAEALKKLDFRVVRVERDLTSEAMRRTLRDFSDEARKSEWAVVFYAGHGIEVGGTNYLLPVDTKLKTDRDAQFEAIGLDSVLASVEGAKKLRLVILDACRENPFLKQMNRTVATRSITRGLARIEPEGGSLVVYAAKAGDVAYDGARDESSPFVRSLLNHLPTPGLEISMLFRLVRDDVLKATDRRQEPFVYGSLSSEALYFRPLASPLPDAAPVPAPVSLPAKSEPPTPQTSPALRAAPARAMPLRRPPAAARKASPAPRVSLAAPAQRRVATPAVARPARAGRAAGGGCFAFRGSTFCE